MVAGQAIHGVDRVWSGQGEWKDRLRSDARAIRILLPHDLRALHTTVVARALAVGARGLVLSGSTARGFRTEISDLDYHLVGPAIETTHLARELDLHVLSEQEFESAILKGDDFVQWSLRFGLVVFDDGFLRAGLRTVAERCPWPDVARKRAHAAKSVDLARRFVATGDEDGALVQVRTALSLAARAHLLGRGVFPLSRLELCEQLTQVGRAAAGDALRAAIAGPPTLEELDRSVCEAEALLESVPTLVGQGPTAWSSLTTGR